jgi:hypothetical protein
MWLAFMLMLTIFHHPEAKTFCLASFLALTKKRSLRDGKPNFFFLQESSPTKSYCLRVVKYRQHQHQGKPHTQEKFQDAAISVKVATLILTGLNLCGTHCK